MSYEVKLTDKTSSAVSIVESIDFTLRQLNECEMAGPAIKELHRLRHRLIERIGDDVVHEIKIMAC